jgi:hypothetical protein
MLVVTSLVHSVEVELLIADIEKIGVSKEKIFATALNKISPTESNNTKRLVDRGMDVTFIDLAFAIGTALSVIGAIYGYALKWGPIIWGLIGFFLGVIIAYLLTVGSSKKQSKRKDNDPTEVLLFIDCDESLHRKLKELFLAYETNGTAVLVRD